MLHQHSTRQRPAEAEAWAPGALLTPLRAVDVQRAVQAAVHPLGEAAVGREPAAQHHYRIVVFPHASVITEPAAGTGFALPLRRSAVVAGGRVLRAQRGPPPALPLRRAKAAAVTGQLV